MFGSFGSAAPGQYIVDEAAVAEPPPVPAPVPASVTFGGGWTHLLDIPLRQPRPAPYELPEDVYLDGAIEIATTVDVHGHGTVEEVLRVELLDDDVLRCMADAECVDLLNGDGGDFTFHLQLEAELRRRIREGVHVSPRKPVVKHDEEE
jgi:hypothetical protein